MIWSSSGQPYSKTQIHSSRNTFFNQKWKNKKSLKKGIQGNNLHIFLWYLLFKSFFFIPQKPFKIAQKLYPWKTLTQSQAKPKPSFSQYPFFNSKEYYGNKYLCDFCTFLSFYILTFYFLSVWTYFLSAHVFMNIKVLKVVIFVWLKTL